MKSNTYICIYIYIYIYIIEMKLVVEMTLAGKKTCLKWLENLQRFKVVGASKKTKKRKGLRCWNMLSPHKIFCFVDLYHHVSLTILNATVFRLPAVQLRTLSFNHYLNSGALVRFRTLLYNFGGEWLSPEITVNGGFEFDIF